MGKENLRNWNNSYKKKRVAGLDPRKTAKYLANQPSIHCRYIFLTGKIHKIGMQGTGMPVPCGININFNRRTNEQTIYSCD